jgi:hypothetical protein
MKGEEKRDEERNIGLGRRKMGGERGEDKKESIVYK